jgi:hypothetical protein
MNIKNLTKLVKVLESDKAQEHFNMSVVCTGPDINTCGAVACIGGWANLIQHGDKAYAGDYRPLYEAGNWLGLAEDQSMLLFLPPGEFVYLTNPKDGAKVVQHLIETGKVNWSILNTKQEETV